MSTTRVNTKQFMGYDVTLLDGLSHMGKSLIGNDQLFEAVQAYAKQNVKGATTHLGPAILSATPHIAVESMTTIRAPKVDTVPPITETPEIPKDADEAWDALELDDLIALAAKHDVTIPGRVKTHGKVKGLLIQAGIAPPVPVS